MQKERPRSFLLDIVFLFISAPCEGTTRHDTSDDSDQNDADRLIRFLLFCSHHLFFLAPPPPFFFFLLFYFLAFFLLRKRDGTSGCTILKREDTNLCSILRLCFFFSSVFVGFLFCLAFSPLFVFGFFCVGF